VHFADDPTQPFAVLDLVVAPGERESRTTTARGVEIKFTVGVSRNSDRAVTQVTATRGGKFVLNQRSEVELRPPGRAIVPLR
jgi:hypothetical protein